MKKPILSPATVPATPKTKTGGGTWDGEKGYPPRTKSPDAPPEKVRD